MPLDTLTPLDKIRVVRMLDANARSDIELYCRHGESQLEASGLVVWIDIGQIPECPVEKQMVEDAIWWCEIRGLLLYHMKIRLLVRFKNIAPPQYMPAYSAPDPAA